MAACDDNATHFASICPDPWADPDSAEAVGKTLFWLGGVAYCAVAAAGIIANLVIILVFSAKELRSTFHMCLLVLAVYDNLYLIICFTNEGLQIDPGTLNGHEPRQRPVWVQLYPAFLHPLQHLFQTASMYMMVAVSVHRYVAIVHPFRYSWRMKEDGSGNRLNGNLVAASAAGVLLGSALFALPHFFEFTQGEDECGNPVVKDTWLRDNPIYTNVYTILIDFILRVIFPAASMIYTNLRIYLVIRSKPDIAGMDRQFAATVFLLVLVFLVCQSGKVANNIMEFSGDCKAITSLGGYILNSAAGVLLVINSSVNIFIYCHTSKSFREHLKDWSWVKCFGRGKKRSGAGARATGAAGDTPTTVGTTTGVTTTDDVAIVEEDWSVVFGLQHTREWWHRQLSSL